MKGPLTFVWATSLIVLAYLVNQGDFPLMFALYSLSFGAYALLCSFEWSWKSLLIIGLTTRLLLIPAFPLHSDDIYRYLWDGLCVLEGLLPYGDTPRQWAELISRPDLLEAMNSPDYHALYPPSSQLFFTLSAWLSHGDVQLFFVILKGLILLMESLFLYFIWRSKLAPESTVCLWILNPLVLIETYGNAHFDLILLPLLIMSLYYLVSQKWKASALAWAMAIGAKITPLLLGPIYVIKSWSQGKSTTLMTWAFISIILVMSPMILSFVQLSESMSSVGLFFQKFEFNASVYFILRWIGFQLKGYNLISYMGPVLAILTAIVIVLIALKRTQRFHDLVESALLSYFIYLIGSTTVHPWYLITPLGLAIFTHHKWPYVWSFLIVLSYGFYWDENLSPWFIGMEYVLLGLTIWIERAHKKESPLLG